MVVNNTLPLKDDKVTPCERQRKSLTIIYGTGFIHKL